jgi:hypothetical protein
MAEYDAIPRRGIMEITRLKERLEKITDPGGAGGICGTNGKTYSSQGW